MNAFLGCFGIIMFPETVCKDLEINTAGNADVVFSDDRMNTLFLTRWLFHIFAKACSRYV